MQIVTAPNFSLYPRWYKHICKSILDCIFHSLMMQYRRSAYDKYWFGYLCEDGYVKNLLHLCLSGKLYYVFEWNVTFIVCILVGSYIMSLSRHYIYSMCLSGKLRMQYAFNWKLCYVIQHVLKLETTTCVWEKSYNVLINLKLVWWRM